jgi:hypothetical protein
VGEREKKGGIDRWGLNVWSDIHVHTYGHITYSLTNKQHTNKLADACWDGDADVYCEYSKDKDGEGSVIVFAFVALCSVTIESFLQLCFF